MPAILLTWNPDRFSWDDLRKNANQVAKTKKLETRWSCGNSKNIPIGTRFFMVRLGVEPKGIIGSGYTLSKPFKDKHWERDNDIALYVRIVFHMLKENPSVSLRELQRKLPKVKWNPQASGVSIKDQNAIKWLEDIWEQRTQEEKSTIPIHENTENIDFKEGKRIKYEATRIERKVQAKKICISHYGSSCAVCGVTLSEFYGPIATGLIHVHHLNPISESDSERSVDPITELRPVCPNCHAVIHLKTPPYRIDELQQYISEHNSK
ncbi:MAG: HNH endonuclease [Thermodesulfovibrionia bacterium]|nr:HNH endonuclease [Thermodesulfovibrionia bacterium]